MSEDAGAADRRSVALCRSSVAPRAPQLARSLYSATIEIAGAQPIQQVERNFSCTRPHREYNTEGLLQYFFGTYGNWPGSLMRPHQFGVDTDGTLYIANYDGRYVSRFVPKFDADVSHVDRPIDSSAQGGQLILNTRDPALDRPGQFLPPLQAATRTQGLPGTQTKPP